MTDKNRETRWLTERDIARLLHLHEGTIRTWRMYDAREGRGSPDKPGRGGLVWKRFGRAIRYAPLPELIGAGR